jgi:hypothetical protein
MHGVRERLRRASPEGHMHVREQLPGEHRQTWGRRCEGLMCGHEEGEERHVRPTRLPARRAARLAARLNGIGRGLARRFAALRLLGSLSPQLSGSEGGGYARHCSNGESDMGIGHGT